MHGRQQAGCLVWLHRALIRPFSSVLDPTFDSRAAWGLDECGPWRSYRIPALQLALRIPDKGQVIQATSLSAAAGFTLVLPTQH